MPILCRCEKHKPKNNRKYIYTHFTEPIGYPDTSSICGAEECIKAGFIFMDNIAVNNYNYGKRIFEFPNNATEVKVKDLEPKQFPFNI
jgi:hypothetical protein